MHAEFVTTNMFFVTFFLLFSHLVFALHESRISFLSPLLLSLQLNASSLLEHLGNDNVVKGPQDALEVNTPGTASVPGGAAALEGVHLLDEVVLEVLLGDVHVHGAVVGPRLDDQVLGGGGAGDDAALDEGVKVVADDLLGALESQVLLADHDDAEVVVGEVVEPGVVVRSGDSEVVVGGGGGRGVDERDTTGEGRVADEGAVDGGELHLVEDGLLGAVQVEGLQVGLGGLNGDEESAGQDQSRLARSVLDVEGDADGGAEGLVDGAGVEHVLAETLSNLLVHLDVAAGSRGEGRAETDEATDHLGTEGREDVEGEDVGHITGTETGGLEDHGHGIVEVVLLDELGEGKEEILGDLAALGEVEVAGEGHVLVLDGLLVHATQSGNPGRGGRVGEVGELASVEVNILGRGGVPDHGAGRDVETGKDVLGRAIVVPCLDAKVKPLASDGILVGINVATLGEEKNVMLVVISL